jgi:hypothetical protein
MAKNLTAKDVKVGDQLKAKNDVYISYGIQKGEIYEVHLMNGANVMLKGYGNWIPLNTFEKPFFSKTELHRRKAELTKEITDIDNKLEWIQSTGATEYNETEYKVWQVLQQMKTDLPEMDKIKAIAALIKG